MLKEAEAFGLQDTRASLCRDSGGWVPGDVERVSENALIVEFARDARVALPMGSMEDLVFAGGDMSNTYTVTARVVARTECESKSRYEFHMLAEDGRALVSLINRRMSVRVKPKQEAPVRVQFEIEGAEETKLIPVKDISIMGVGVVVEPQAEQELLEVDGLYLRLWLPAAEQGLRIFGRVRSRRLVKKSILYGFLFDEEQTENFAAIQEQVKAYTSEREEETREVKNSFRS